MFGSEKEFLSETELAAPKSPGILGIGSAKRPLPTSQSSICYAERTRNGGLALGMLMTKVLASSLGPGSAYLLYCREQSWGL